MPPRPKLLNAEALKEARSDVRQSRDEKRLRKRENTRVSLVQAAADVVAAKGIEGARIDDVVKAAGFTRGAFYSNYSSLDEVLSEAIVERSQALIARIEEAIDGLEGDVTVDVLMDLLDSIRPDARSMYLITTEYTLRRMRHPETPEIPVATREEFTAALSGIVEDLLARMGRRPLVPASAVADVVVLFFLFFVVVVLSFLFSVFVLFIVSIRQKAGQGLRFGLLDRPHADLIVEAHLRRTRRRGIHRLGGTRFLDGIKKVSISDF